MYVSVLGAGVRPRPRSILIVFRPGFALDALVEHIAERIPVIGKKGAMLKKIGELARTDIEAFMGTKVYLQTWVKVKENWRDSLAQLRNFGFNND